MWHGRLPKGAAECAPVYHGNILRFDGKGNYIVFPVDTLPAGAFTVKFSCRPASRADMVLFRHAKHIPCSIESWIENGKLKLAYTSIGYNYRNLNQEFETDLEVKIGQWNDIEISYDYQYLRARVNGKTAIFAFNKRPGNFGPACFGGFNALDKGAIARDLKFFYGELRSLEIIHNALPLTAADIAMLAAQQAAAAKKININGKFIGGSRLARQWYFNRGIKPRGKSSVKKAAVGNAAVLTPQPGGTAQIYSTTFPVKTGEVIKLKVRVKGKSGMVGINFYDAKSRYIHLGLSQQFANQNGVVEHSFTVPARGRGGVPAMARITLTASGGNPAEFSELEVSR